MTATVSQAVATREHGPQALIAEYRADFAQVLPSHIKPETFVRLSQGLLRRNDKLRKAAEANPGSFLAALLDCARLGHEPGTDQYALVPFGGEIVGIEQYQGEIERMYRAGGALSVHADVVREHDSYAKADPARGRLLPAHDYDPFADDAERGGLRGVYAYAQLVGGAWSRVVQMGRAEVMRHKAVSKLGNAKDSPWNGPFEHSMWLKTAVHELEKWVPTSAEYRREQLRAARDVAAEPGRSLIPAAPSNVDTDTGEIVDGVVVEDPPDNAWPEVTQPGTGGGS